MIRTAVRGKYFYLWALIFFAGALWGASLSRTLAQILYIPFFYSAWGVLLCGLLCVIIVCLGALYSLKKHNDLEGVAQLCLPLYLSVIDVISPVPHPWRGPVLLGISLVLIFLTKVELSQLAGLALAVIIPLLVYLPYISPYVGRADTFEFQVVAPQLGVAHPSGYPLYVLIGKIFSLLPLGTSAWRVNLSSSVLAACASGLLYACLTAYTQFHQHKLNIKYRRMVGVFCGWTLAFSPTLWSRAVEAEVYALNACIVALTLWITVMWLTSQLSSNRALPILGFIMGLAVASHLTLGALIVIVITAMLYKRRELSWRAVLSAFLLGLIGLSIYLLIPLRWPAVTGGERMSFQHFVRFVTNAESGGALLPRAFLNDPARWALVYRLFRQQVGWIGLTLSAAGIIMLFTHIWPLALGTLLSCAAWIWFNLSFYVAEPDYSSFLIPAHVMAVFWLGVGVPFFLSAVQRYSQWMLRLSLAVFVLLPASRIWLTGPALETKKVGLQDEQWGRYVLSLPIQQDAVILADSEKFPPLYYLQQVVGLRPDLRLVTLFDENQYKNALTDYLAEGQTVYVARYLPGLDEYGVSSLGPLVRVAPDEEPRDTQPMNITFGKKLALRDFELEADPQGRRMHHLTLHWSVIEDVKEDLEVRIRLVNQHNAYVVWNNDPSRPVGGYSSTLAWVAGESVQDYYALPQPLWIPTGSYYLEIGMFPRFGDQGLPINAGTEDWVRLATLDYGEAQNHYSRMMDLQMPQQVIFGDNLWLLSNDVPHELARSSTTPVDILWLCDNVLPESLIPEFAWVSQETAETIPALAYEQSSGADILGHLVCHGKKELRRYMLDVPDQIGEYILYLGLRDEDSAPQPARCQWVGLVEESCSIAHVTVTPSDLGAANYDNKLLLLNATLEVDEIGAGGPLTVSLKWRSLRSMDLDYTMFLQIIGPDGQVYGQVDSWPEQGGRPTSGWGIGEEIDDQYTVYVKEGAPSGEYKVILGWYLLADMGRIPIVSATGKITNDFYILGTFSLTPEGGVD